MFFQLNLRRILILLFAVCLIVRVGFIFGEKQVPVMWDARIYSSAAVGLIYYLQNGGAFGHPENYPAADSAFQQAQFDSYLNRYINGEQIEWLYYKKPTIAAAQEYIFISGPILPAYLSLIFWQNILPDFMVVRFLNAIIDSLCLILLFLVADNLFRRRAALLAALIIYSVPAVHNIDRNCLARSDHYFINFTLDLSDAALAAGWTEERPVSDGIDPRASRSDQADRNSSVCSFFGSGFSMNREMIYEADFFRYRKPRFPSLRLLFPG